MSGPILCAVDFSADSEAALLWACNQAELTGNTLVLLHVVHDPAASPGFYRRPGGDWPRPLTEVAEEMQEEFLGKVRRDHPSQAALQSLKTRIVRGTAAEPHRRGCDRARRIPDRGRQPRSDRAAACAARLGRRARRPDSHDPSDGGQASPRPHDVSVELDQFALWTGLFGGLALFLYGMDVMTVALKRAAGDHLKDLLGRMTSNRFVGVGVGAFVTGIVNSSSVTTVILVGFISAGLMSMAQSVAVIMGANIGSTVTAQILAFSVTRFALPMVTLGFLIAFIPKGETTREYGRMLLGAGLVFYGMGLMSGAMAPLRDYPPFIDFIGTLANPIAGALAGMAFTAIIQSSAATTGIVIVLAGQGVMTLETAIAVALGANVGTCATAGLAVIGKPREAVRAAVVHVLFNVAGVAIWIGFIPQLAEIARAISPGADNVPGALRAAAELPRQVANAHTIFNVVNTLVFIGFTTQIARLVEWLVPDRPLDADEPLLPKYHR